MILSEAEARALIARALSFASASELRVNLSGGRAGNTRFALNSITTSGDEDRLEVGVTAYHGRRHGTASGTEIDDDSLRRLVQSAETLARFAPEDPEYVPELGPQSYLGINPYFESTAAAGPELRAKSARAAIEPARARELTAAGFFSHAHDFTAVGNNKELFGYFQSTQASFSATLRGEGGGSGWGGDNSRRVEQVDFAAASERAARKARESRAPRTLEPGVYPVILEPQAVGDFMQFALFSLSARMADEGRSFFAKPGGGNKIGQRLAGDGVTIRSDPTHPDLLGEPFRTDGFPAKKRVWFEQGVLKNLFYDRYWAQKQGVEPTGFPQSIVFEGGAGSLDDLIRDTDRAVLVTRFWYIRFVDPQTLLLTGLTRDGTFWVEGGKIRHAVKNFRFNESPMAVLNKVTGLSRPLRRGNLFVPALRARAFTFSSISEAV